MLPLLLLCAVAGPLAQAEAALLAGDPDAVHAALAAVEPSPRATRLLLDAALLEQDFIGAPAIAQRLARAPGWQVHAAVQMAHLDALRIRRWLSRTGLGMFALALAMLAIGGARELLRLSLETILAALGVGAAIALGWIGGSVFAELLAFYGGALLGVTHATFATFRRTLPGARGRAVLMALVLLAMGGVLLATLAQIPPAEIVARGLGSGRG